MLKKFVLMAGILGLAGLVSPIFAENEILFQAGFNKGFDADIAAGKGQADQYGVGIIADGKKGGAAELTRSDILSYPGAENFNPENGTVDFWFKPYWSSTITYHDTADDGQKYHTLFKLGAKTGKNRIWCRYDDHYNELQLRISSTTNGEAGSVAASHFCFKANNWYHIACVWERAKEEKGIENLQIYVEGKPLTEKKDFIPPLHVEIPQNATIDIGCREHLEEEGCNGVMDEFRIYNRALKREEINSLWRNFQENKPKIATPSVDNLIKNSSFEITTARFVPDYWGGDNYFTNPRFYENFKAVESADAIHGQKYMMLRRQEEDSGKNIVRLSHYINRTPPGTYTLSGYFKSDKKGAQVLFYGHPLNITDSWERCSVKIELKERTNLGIGLSLAKPGVLWIDAVQLEPEDTMHAYVPDEITEPRAVKKKAQSNIPPNAAPIPMIKCRMIKTPPLIDGRLSEDCWKNSEKIDLVLHNTAAAPGQKTSAWILRDNDNLYVGFKCFDNAMEKITAKRTMHDAPVYLDDSVEVFIVLDKNMERCFQIIANTIETVADTMITYSPFSSDFAWESDAEVKVIKASGYWTCEMAIPFYALGVNQFSANKWRINLQRENHKANEYSVFSAGYDTTYKVPERFAIVDMGDFAGINNIHKIEVKNLQFLNIGKQKYNLIADISNPLEQDRSVLVNGCLDDKDFEVNNKKILLQKGNNLQVSLGEYVITGKVTEAKIIFSDLNNRRINVTRSRVKVPKPVSGYIRQSYYTAENEAEVILNINGVESEYSCAANIQKQDTGNKPGLFTNTFHHLARGENTIKIDIASLPAGSYQVCVNLLDKDNEILDSFEDILTKYTSAPAGCNEVKVDRKRRVLLVNGDPFVPYGLYGTFLEGEKAYAGIKYLKEKGFNTVVLGVSWRGEKNGFQQHEDIEKALDLAHKLKMKAVFYFCMNQKYFEPLKDIINENNPYLRLLVKEYKNHPALLGYWFADEPGSDSTIWGKNEKDVQKMHAILQKEAPYHLSSAIWNGFSEPGKYYGGLAASDEILMDIYLFIHPICFYQGLKNIEKAEAIAVENNMLLEIILGTYGYGDSIREPTPSEHLMQIYLFLIRGVKGIYNYCGKPMSRDLWESFYDVGIEIEKLRPVIIDGIDLEKPGVNSDGILLSFKKHDKVFYLITVNITKEEKLVEINLGGTSIHEAKKAKVMFENRTVSIKNGILKDTFKGNERHVYIIK